MAGIWVIGNTLFRHIAVFAHLSSLKHARCLTSAVAPTMNGWGAPRERCIMTTEWMRGWMHEPVSKGARVHMTE